MPLNVGELTRLENSILESKQDISRISETRSKATLSKDERAALRAWTDASEKTLEGCSAISKYLDHFSRPIARQLQASLDATKSSLETVKRTGDPKQFHVWMKTQFIPHVKQSESMAHLATTAMHKAQERNADFHRWVKGGTNRSGR
jgi:hypothetical protein